MAGKETRQPAVDRQKRGNAVRFRRRAWLAADAALRLWIVRVPCGVMSLLMLAAPTLAAIDATTWRDWLGLGGMLPGAVLLGRELALVAILGKSRLLRFMLSGVSPEDHRRAEKGA